MPSFLRVPAISPRSFPQAARARSAPGGKIPVILPEDQKNPRSPSMVIPNPTTSPRALRHVARDSIHPAGWMSVYEKESPRASEGNRERSKRSEAKAPDFPIFLGIFRILTNRGAI